MFVSYNPYLAFDVHREECTCVCGKEAELTNARGEARGYCSICYRKKLKFIDNLVGFVDLGTQENNIAVRMVEAMRVKMMGDRISYMIDTYFANNEGDDPYNDIHFVIRCYHDKSRVLDSIKDELEGMLGTTVPRYQKRVRKGIIPSPYDKYYDALGKMNAKDWGIIQDLCERRDQMEEEAHKLELKNNNGN